MKFLPILVLLLCLSGPVWVSAQGQIIFYDDFNTNAKDWPDEDQPGSVRYDFSNGKYYLDNLQDKGAWIVSKEIRIDQERDFEIILKMEKIGGGQTSGSGLSFGRKDNKNNYTFYLSGRGGFNLVREENDFDHDLIPWTDSEHIRTGNFAPNTIKVRKEGTQAKFYINDELVAEQSFQPFFGDRLGFHIGAKQKVAIDYLQVTYLDEWVPKDNFTTGLPPILSISDITFSEATLDAEETAELSLTIQNIGPGDARNVSVNLSGTLTGLDFPRQTLVPTIQANGGSQTVTILVRGEFNLPTDQATLDVELIEPNFKVKIPGKKVSFPTRAFKEPELILAKYAMLEYQSANPNNQLDLNEMVDLKIAIQNIGQGDAESLQIEVQNNQTGVLPLGVVENNGLVRKNPSFDRLATGKYETVIYRYFINSEFTAPELEFNIIVKERLGRFGLTEIKRFPINTQLEEAGFIRSVAKDDDRSRPAVVIEDIPDFVVDVDVNIPNSGASQPHTYALIIGNEDYQSRQTGLSAEQNVPFATNDAQVFALYCEKTLGIPKRQIKLIKNATAAEIRQGLAWINNLAKVENGQAKLVFYYSGHGLPDQQSKVPYLIPVDVSGANLQYGVKLEEVYQKLTEHPSEQITVLLDACFSGGARNQPLLASKGIRIRPKTTGIAGNMVVFSSSTGEETSNVFPEKQHGFFTYFLLKKLQETGGNTDFKSLIDYLQRTVPKETGLINRIQNPEVQVSSKVGDDWQYWRLSQ